MKVFLCSYHPLCKSAKGREICETYGLAPYLDASIRREPDFQCPLPAITGLCRLDKLVGRIRNALSNNEEAYIVYVTVKAAGPRRLVAVLRANHVSPSHKAASDWYKSNIGTVPSNCMTPENPPLPLSYAVNLEACRSHAQWDKEYLERSKLCGIVVACTVEFMDVWTPPLIPETLFGTKFPGTQNPKDIEAEGLARIRAFLAARTEFIELFRWECSSAFDPYTDRVDHAHSPYASDARFEYSKLAGMISMRFGTDQWLFAQPDEPMAARSYRMWKLRVPRHAVLARLDSFSWCKLLAYDDGDDSPEQVKIVAGASPNENYWRAALGSDLKWKHSPAQYVLKAPLAKDWIVSEYIESRGQWKQVSCRV